MEFECENLTTLGCPRMDAVKELMLLEQKGVIKMDINELKLLQNYPLDLKIEKTKLRIREWYEYHNGDVYVSFSGGADSTVLLDIVRSIYPDVEAVFCNTGLEYPEIVKFVKEFANVTILKPKKTFKQVISEYGYPVISKSVSNTVRLARKNIEEGKDSLRVRQIKGLEKGSKFNKGKWQFLLDAPFKISDQCCDELKKKPFKEFEKITGKKPITGILADEGGIRQEAYLKTGCNNFKKGVCKPLGFWKKQDILHYIKLFDLPICEVYGNIKEKDQIEGQLTIDNKNYSELEFTGEQRTGCMFCMFGCHLEKEPNRFERMKKTHPKQYNYCINKLKLSEVLDYIGVKY